MNRRDVTGRWEGIFNYPRTMPPNGFVAMLVEQAGTISGEIEETSDGGAVLTATVYGERTGSSVRFGKRYADPARAHYAVDYVGTLSPEGDEIVGEWTIPGVWSGSFIMVRQPGREVETKQDTGKTVR